MFIIGKIFCHLSVFIVGQCQFVIFSAVNNPLLDSRVNFAKAHRRSGSAKGFHHLYAGRALLHTDFQALQIFRRINRGLGIKIPGTRIIPGEHTESCLIRRLVNLIHIVCIVHNFMISVLRGKQIGHTENLIYVCKGFQICSTCHNKVDSSCLGQLNSSLSGAQDFVGENLYFVLISQIFLHVFLEFQKSDMFRMGFGLCMRDTNDPFSSGDGRAAAHTKHGSDAYGGT